MKGAQTKGSNNNEGRHISKAVGSENKKEAKM